MGAKARAFIQKAIDSYLIDDGATDTGAFRDAVTDVLHMAYERKIDRIKLMDVYTRQDYIDLLIQKTTRSAEEMFEEELANIENEIVHAIPDSELPLHSIDEFFYIRNQDAFEHRLKHKGAIHDTKAQVRNVRKKKKHT